MRETIKNILANTKTKRIGITELVEDLKKKRINILSNDSKKDQFVEIIQELIEEDILIPLKNASPLQLYGKLPSAFIIKKSAISEIFSPLSHIYRTELLSLSYPINIDFYATHSTQYEKDREFILKINDLLCKDSKEILTVCERSYILFGDEKAISIPGDAAVDGNAILKNLKLSLNDIKAKKVYEPFFYTEKNYFLLEGREKRTILIVENKDTFWTLQDALKSGELEYVNLVVYGEGHAIKQKFAYFEMIGGSPSDKYYYFGDLDQEGIYIFNSLTRQFPDHDIKPAKNFYNYIIKKASPEKAKPLRTSQKRGECSLSPFIDFFESKDKEIIKRIITDRKYLPQEILNKSDLSELKNCGLF
jgi:hypothetical protein